jgi:hypothetical protein
MPARRLRGWQAYLLPLLLMAVTDPPLAAARPPRSSTPAS